MNPAIKALLTDPGLKHEDLLNASSIAGRCGEAYGELGEALQYCISIINGALLNAAREVHAARHIINAVGIEPTKIHFVHDTITYLLHLSWKREGWKKGIKAILHSWIDSTCRVDFTPRQGKGKYICSMDEAIALLKAALGAAEWTEEKA